LNRCASDWNGVISLSTYCLWDEVFLSKFSLINAKKQQQQKIKTKSTPPPKSNNDNDKIQLKK
jgi:hypothetical protein